MREHLSAWVQKADEKQAAQLVQLNKDGQLLKQLRMLFKNHFMHSFLMANSSKGGDDGGSELEKEKIIVQKEINKEVIENFFMQRVLKPFISE